MAAAKPSKKELTLVEIGQLVNGMTRERLEELVLKLHEESTDCSDIISETMSSTTRNAKRKGFARNRDTMGSLGTLPPESKWNNNFLLLLYGFNPILISYHYDTKLPNDSRAYDCDRFGLQGIAVLPLVWITLDQD